MSNNSSATPLAPSISEDSYGVFEGPNSTGSPERRLLLAVLERAILDFVGNDTKEIAESEQWLFGELSNPSYREFSFSWVCQELDLDMHTIAKTIHEMPKRGTNRIAPWYFTKENSQNSQDKEGEAEKKVKKSKTTTSKVIEVNFNRVH